MSTYAALTVLNGTFLTTQSHTTGDWVLLQSVLKASLTPGCRIPGVGDAARTSLSAASVTDSQLSTVESPRMKSTLSWLTSRSAAARRLGIALAVVINHVEGVLLTRDGDTAVLIDVRYVRLQLLLPLNSKREGGVRIDPTLMTLAPAACVLLELPDVTAAVVPPQLAITAARATKTSSALTAKQVPPISVHLVTPTFL